MENVNFNVNFHFQILSAGNKSDPFENLSLSSSLLPSCSTSYTVNMPKKEAKSPAKNRREYKLPPVELVGKRLMPGMSIKELYCGLIQMKRRQNENL